MNVVRFWTPKVLQILDSTGDWIPAEGASPQNLLAALRRSAERLDELEGRTYQQADRIRQLEDGLAMRVKLQATDEASPAIGRASAALDGLRRAVWRERAWWIATGVPIGIIFAALAVWFWRA